MARDRISGPYPTEVDDVGASFNQRITVIVCNLKVPIGEGTIKGVYNLN